MSTQGKPLRCEIIHDNFQNYKKYNVPKAQLVIADIPYNIGADAYGSNPMWYKGGDNANGESKYAKKSFFNSDGYFKIAEYMHFCSRLLKPEPKEKGKAPAMIVFCAFDQIHTVAEYGARYGFKNWYPLFFCKNYSAQVLKANMRIVGATELSRYTATKRKNATFSCAFSMRTARRARRAETGFAARRRLCGLSVKRRKKPSP